jgi:polysaccharide pyruvyl transferase WcaK-like protein
VRTRLILVTDGWLANAGDAAIHVAMGRSLRRRLPNHRIAVACHQRDLVGDRYPSLDLVPPLDGLVGLRWPWTSERDLAERAEADALVDAAELVVVPGGGFLEEHYGPEGRIRVWEHLLERGKRLAFYSQTVGRFTDQALRDRLVGVLRRAELVLARDRVSVERLGALGVQAELTADEAFLTPRPRPRLRRRRSLLVTPSAHPWATADGVEPVGDEHIAMLAQSIERLLVSGAVHGVTVASTAQGLGGPRWALEDDQPVAERLRDAVPVRWRDRVEVHSGYVSSAAYLALAARHTAVVSMRMHGAILGAVAGSAAVLANPSLKARELSRRTDGAIRVIESRDDLARLDALVGPMLAAPRAWRSRQAAGVAAMRASATRNAELVAARVTTA